MLVEQIQRFMTGAWLWAAYFFAFASQATGAAVFYENPVIPGDHADPSITRMGKDYWATATSGEMGPEFPIFHSTDLVNWEPVGSVFERRPAWATLNFWAPELWEYRGHSYVYYTARQESGTLVVAMAMAEKPAGPYKDFGPIIAQADGSIDPAPCLDEHGKPFLIWKEDGNSARQPTPIWAQALNDDGTKVIGEAKELIRNDADWEGPLVEGPFILRRDGWFYLFYSGNGCCGPECNYALGVARARAFLGPWEKNPANPILVGNADWKCPGHGSIVADEQGRYWLLCHAYSARSATRGREAILERVIFGTNGWPTINNGSGPSARAVSPFGVVQKNAAQSFYDDFADGRLKPGWQWSVRNEPVIHFRNGHLLLASSRASTRITSLLHPATTADYEATTVLETNRLVSGIYAGLWAYGSIRDPLGLAVSDGKVTLWRGPDKLAEIKLPGGNQIRLRMTATGGNHFRFAVSADGKTWLPVGDPIELPAEHTIRVALGVGGGDEAEGEFDSFRIEPAAR